MPLLKILGRLFVLFIIISSIALFLFYLNQEKLLFYPEKLDPSFQFNFSSKFKEHDLRLNTGKSINYLIFTPPSPKGIVLYFHGNAGSLKDWGLAGMELSKKTNWTVWIMDYPSYGKSSGPLPKNEKILLDMAKTFQSKITAQHPDLPVVLFGRSLGTGIASDLATQGNANALILESPYRSITKMGREIFPILPAFISRFDLDNERNLRSIGSLPTLIMHGQSDRVIPVSHGEFLSHLVPHLKFVSFESGGHNDLADQPGYWPELNGFLLNIER